MGGIGNRTGWGGRRRRTVSQSVVSNVVARRVGEVEEQRRDTGRFVSRLIRLRQSQLLEGNRHGHKAKTHRRSRKHKHMSALKLHHHKCRDHGAEERPVGVSKINARLGIGAGVAHHLVQQVLVVGQQGVSGHLCEEPHHGCDEDAATHAGCAHHVEPGLVAVADFDLDGLFDLRDFSFDEHGVDVAFGVVLDEDGGGLVVAISADQPSGRLGEEA